MPGIRYVIDSGTARISRYSYRAKVQRLPIEAVSQASANQRKGRCGRVEPQAYASLQRARRLQRASGLHRPGNPPHQPGRGDPADAVPAPRRHRGVPFFIEPPDGKAIKDGFTLLQELLAVNREGQLTPLGRQLARLPIDPRLGRMLLEAPSRVASRKC